MIETEPAPTGYWKIDAPFLGENRIRAIVAMTAKRFYLAQFVTAAGLEAADRELAGGADPDIALGRKKLCRQFLLVDIHAVEKTDYNQTVYVFYRKPSGANKREAIPTYTQHLYSEIFDALHDRIAPAAAVKQVQASARQVILKPAICLVLALLATVFFYCVALPLAEENHAHGTGRYAALEELIFTILRELGGGVTLLLGCAGMLLAAAWLLRRVLIRPICKRFDVARAKSTT